jgi:hypothetical protein
VTIPAERAPSPAPESRWRRIRRGWLRGPVVLLVLPLMVGYLVAHTLGDLALGVDGLQPERLITRIVLTCVAGVVLGVVIHRLRARPIAGPDGLELQEAVEDGCLPPSADAEAWTGALLRRRAAVEAETAPTQLLLGVGLVVASVAWGVFGGPWITWPVAVVMAAVVIALRMTAARRIARIDAVLMPLLDAEAAAAATAADAANAARATEEEEEDDRDDRPA